MNYYRRYCGDYAADTPHLSMLEHGAYTLMLDAYYTSERPLPDSFDLLYRICRAQTAAEKKAVRNVAAQFFPSDGEFRHNGRADKELAIAVPKLEKLRAVARENGKKSHGPKRKDEPDRGPTPDPNPGPDLGPKRGPDGNPSCRQPLSASHQPPTETPNPITAFPVVETSRPSAPPAEAVSDSNPKPEAGMLDRMVAECERAKVANLAEGRAVVERWHRQGATPSQVAKACVEARRSLPEPRELSVGYVSTIVERIVREDAEVRAKARASEVKAQEQAARQREMAKNAAPPPDELMARFRKRGAAA